MAAFVLDELEVRFVVGFKHLGLGLAVYPEVLLLRIFDCFLVDPVMI